MNVAIAYFSGTGSTAHVAAVFRRELEARGRSVQMIKIGRPPEEDRRKADLLILCFVVHGLNAPQPVLDWVEGEDDAHRLPAAVVSVSAGGEITPNRACRVSLKKALSKRNYAVFYEKMLVMPSNGIVPTNPMVIDKLLELLPAKVSYCVQEIEQGKERLTRPGAVNRLLSLLARAERKGARRFGRRILVGEACTGCSLCAQSCPVGNILMDRGRPRFLNRCTACLRCLYGCPQKALAPRRGGFLLLKEGYDFASLLRHRKKDLSFDIKKETKGVLWTGVRRYLLRSDDTLAPRYTETGNRGDRADPLRQESKKATRTL